MRLKLLGMGTVGVTGTRSVAAAAVGMGGVGKTTETARLSRDPRVHARFCDGIVWLAFGRGAKPKEKAKQLVQDYLNKTWAPDGTDCDDRDQLTEKEYMQLRDALASKPRTLLVLDDIWQRSHAISFCRAVRAVPESGLIISARDSGLAIELFGRGGDALVKVGAMSEPEALRLLGQMCSPPDDSLSDDDAKALAFACGYLPVALKALGAMVDTQSGRTWSSVRGDFAERKLRMLEGNVEDYEKIVECALGFSVDALDPAHRRRYLLLALLAYPDMPIDEKEAAELWEAAENCPLVLSKLDAEQACAFLDRMRIVP